MYRNVQVGYQVLIGLLFFVFTSLVQARNLPDFIDLVEKSKPAVVNISTVQNGQKNGQGHGIDPRQMPEIFRKFFGDELPRQQPPRQSKRSLGSGFIISSDGYILTNNHVVADADKIIVRLIDRRELEATLIGSDKRSDLALLKIDAQDLPVVELGDSDDLEVGEWVLAIGSPFGFDYSVTAGIVSAIGRNLPRENYVPFIQTDVAINPGNSGGPLFNLDGEVVGINSQIYTRSGGFMGLSFAIPMSVAMDVVDQLKGNGHVSRGWLGVVIQNVNRELAESFSLDRAAGALVAAVLPESPAEKGGLQEGDIIIRFSGHGIDLSSDLPHVVGKIKPGETVPVLVVRGGDKKTLQLVVGELPEDTEQLSQYKKNPGHERVSRLGLTVADINEQLAARSGISEGVVVVEVHKGSAARAGLQRGDIITQLNRTKIRSAGQFEIEIGKVESGKTLPVRVVRRGRPSFIALKVE